MKPAPFAYHAPERLEDVVGLLSDDAYESRVLAGGQSLVPMMNFRLAVPEVLVDIRHVEELRHMRIDAEGGLAVGAAVTQSMLLRDPRTSATWPLLSEGVRNIGHPQVRSRGTVCGSLAHHDPHGELPALAVALDATMVVAGPAGRREVAAEDFFVSYYEVALEPDEVLVEVRFPKPDPDAGWAFREITRRRGDFALIGLACVARPAGARIVAFGAAEKPVSIDVDADADSVGDLVAGSIDPLDDLHASAEYRREAAAALAEEALTEARERMGA